MSTAKSTKSAGAAKFTLSPELYTATSLPVADDPESLPFPEWSDQDINVENWRLSKSKLQSSEVGGVKYVDPHVIRLPKFLNAETWKRPEEFYPKANIVIYSETSDFSHFISRSEHLLESDFVRSFISSMDVLQYITENRRSPIEFTKPTYIPTTEGVAWKPWHHIYSNCKGGKDQKHLPTVNELGKYVVRLFWFGCWRKITVDDLLPIAKCKVTLPTLVDPNYKKREPKKTASKQVNDQEIELWPFILSKALLKLASLSKTDTNELLDFDIIHCLTGWFLYKVDVSGIDPNDIWQMCASYTDHYTWPETDTINSISTTFTSRTFVESGGPSCAPFYLIGVCSDLKSLDQNAVPDFSPCWSHGFLIDQTRNIPLTKQNHQEELARWKHFRWMSWAIRNGLWHPPDLGPFKCFKIISSFKQPLRHSFSGKESTEIGKCVAAVEEFAPQKEISNSCVNKSNNKASFTDNKTIWVDFEKIAPYLSHLYIYFRSSNFKNITKISNVSLFSKELLKGEKDKDKRKSNNYKSGFSMTGSKLLIWNNKLLPSRNEPLYIFSESSDYKFVIVNFAQEGNVHALSEDTIENFEDAFSYVIIEDYNWKTAAVGETVAFLNTYGNKSLIIDIKPGRFVFRMWIKSERSFCIHIMSNTHIEICTLERILELMCEESERLLKLMDSMSDQFDVLIMSFGTATYTEQLQSFYRSYLPHCNLTKHELITAHRCLITDFSEIIKEVSQGNAIRDRLYALQALFLNPHLIAPSTHYFSVSSNPESNSSENFESLESTTKVNAEFCSTESVATVKSDIQIISKDEAATTIQAFFKMVYVINLKRSHKPTHKYFQVVQENLKKIYNDVFNVVARRTKCTDLIRRYLLYNAEMSSLRKYYPILKDLESTIHLQQFMGSVTVVASSWVPIVRYIFYCNSLEKIVVKVCLFCNISKYVVRIFNNDDNTEIVRFPTDVVVREYSSNTAGYTVLCYGWPNFDGECIWKLDFATLKTCSACLLVIQEAYITTNIVRNNYKPNPSNYICRCIVKIYNDVMLSFRLSTSYSEVDLQLTCLNEERQEFGTISGVNSLILPNVMLKYVPKDSESLSMNTTSKKTITSKSRLSSMVQTSSKPLTRSSEKMTAERRSSRASSTATRSGRKSSLDVSKIRESTYLVEGYVLNKSWPLTRNEWDIVEEVKAKNLIGSHILSVSKLNVLGSKRFSSKDPVVCQLDNRRQDEINRTKMNWYENNKNRYIRAKQLRDDYLESHYIKETDVESNETDSKNKLEEVSIQPSLEQESFDTSTSKCFSVTHVKPEPFNKRLPPLNLLQYIHPDVDTISQERCVLSAEDEEEAAEQKLRELEDFNCYYESYQSDKEKFLNEHVGKFELLNDFYKRCTEESEELMRSAYNARKRVIERVNNQNL
ncbi:hypothetical protein FQA39_LY13910 [Lamprigera yunnana]|nr:hypothetical protein FQA39_LY13910 [Lamprigera yunnana]